MRKLILYITLLFCITSCRTQVGYSLNDTVFVETIHYDTIISFAADSASVTALLQCDSMGNVLLHQIDFLQGDNLTLQARLLHNTPVTTLLVDCKQDSLQQEVELLTKKIRENRTEVRTIEVPKKMNAWQAFIQVSGYIAWSCLILGFILKIILKAKGIYGL